MQPHPFAPTGLLVVMLRLDVSAGGTQGTEMTLSPAAPTQVRSWPGYPRCDPASGFKGGLGDTYATSLYTIPEYEGTRQHYRDTVAEQTRCEKLGVRHVTPWLWIGGAPTHLLAALTAVLVLLAQPPPLSVGAGGYRRVVVSGRPGGASGDMQWDYSLAYSWMIGRELADPFYSSKPDRYAPWGHARVVVLFPNMCAHPRNAHPAAAWPG